ncbi:MAG: inositol monophosphatase [Lewinellaceae bacterium]|nr:inositol monophosphatase [Saprospiraceae bacterium]MCB9338514.1 inositol monophosphatase [Lewinellaceae bacterium]
MNEKDLSTLCRKSCDIVEATAAFIRGELGRVGESQIEDKSLNSLVSYVDKTAEEQLVGKLSDLLPGAVFLTEEGTVAQESGEFQWIIDPLDGTTNFLHQVPCFAVSVGLRQGEELVLGIVYEVNRKECFYAWKNGGAFLNGRAIHVSPKVHLKDSLLATGFPYRDYAGMDNYFVALRQFMQKTRGLRRLGAAAVDLAYVACGRFDGFFEYGLSAWDVAGGAVLVKEAGGRVCDFGGGDDYLFGGEMVACSRNVEAELMQAIRSAFAV